MSDYPRKGRAVLTITSQDQELILISQIMYVHIGEGGHDLSLRRQLSTLLELEVTNRT